MKNSLLGKIMTDLELEKPPRPGKKTYYHMFPEKKSNTVNALNKLNKK